MSVRSGLRTIAETAFWRPSNARVLLATRPGRRRPTDVTSASVRLGAVAEWLTRAQDATSDGGVSWGYRLRRGWAPSYPETTGYIIPTLLAIGDRLGDPTYQARAERALGFLEPLQLPGGAFPGGRVDAPEPSPSVFNTGQIINGLTEWYRRTGDERIGSMAARAGAWLVGVQDDDGAWRRHGYAGYPVTYTAHASCWLAELGTLTGDRQMVATAERHLDWFLRQQDPATGWFERTGFTDEDHAARRSVTHTLAYTLWGVLWMGILLDRADAVAAVRRPARQIADVVRSTGRLPGVLDARWMGRAGYACLTGNAQMSLIWKRMVDLEPDAQLLAAAETALGVVGAAQSTDSSDPGILGGVPGSDPIWGDYIPNALPNWAAKFYADALMAVSLASGSEPAQR